MIKMNEENLKKKGIEAEGAKYNLEEGKLV